MLQNDQAFSWNTELHICGALRHLVPFAKSKRREKHP